VGVGFMGGSFARALKASGFKGRVYGYDVNPENLKKALELGLLDEGTVKIEEVKKFEPDLVMLSSPVRTFVPLAERLAPLLPAESTVTDQGSVKGKLVYELERILGERFVGGHPIAGTEKSGPEHSLAELYRGKKVVLTPTERTDYRRLEEVKRLWERLGAKVELMSPELHDFVFGAVSHLPHAVAFALVDALISLSDEVDLFRYPGAGFKDFTRIAKSDPVMWRDIFITNRENVLKAIEAYEASLKKLKELIKEGKLEELTEYLKKVKLKRTEMEKWSG